MLDRLEIVVSGTHTHTPAELLASDGMKHMIEQARLQYDYIIIDTPPVLPVTDARALGVLADATFFVYRAGKTARRALTRAREELNLAGVKVKGIILNQATPEVTLTDSYYYQYYGEKKPKRSAGVEKLSKENAE
jgi:capsular exopolysaccharide synthesis family protein